MQVICFASPRTMGPFSWTEFCFHNQETVIYVDFLFPAVSYLTCQIHSSIFEVLQQKILLYRLFYE